VVIYAVCVSVYPLGTPLSLWPSGATGGPAHPCQHTILLKAHDQPHCPPQGLCPLRLPPVLCHHRCPKMPSSSSVSGSCRHCCQQLLTSKQPHSPPHHPPPTRTLSVCPTTPPQLSPEALLVPGQRQLLYVHEAQLDQIIQDQGRAVLACLQNPDCSSSSTPKLLGPSKGSWAVSAAVVGVQRLPGSSRALVRLVVTDKVAVQVGTFGGGGRAVCVWWWRMCVVCGRHIRWDASSVGEAWWWVEGWGHVTCHTVWVRLGYKRVMNGSGVCVSILRTGHMRACPVLQILCQEAQDNRRSTPAAECIWHITFTPTRSPSYGTSGHPWTCISCELVANMAH
jgi:hypothetical protein